jgi:hypothetical protein
MDTRFWGPSGWKMLHYITYIYPSNPTKTNKVNMLKFIKTLPYILPCKFCRYSLTCYIQQDQPKLQIDSAESIRKWLFRIHNKVNDKLRTQNLNPSLNPSFNYVDNFYKKWLKEGDPLTCHLPTFWDFLFSVAYNHPKESSKHSKPMSDCPKSVYTCKNLDERNKWNILSPEKRQEIFENFWHLLPKCLGPVIGDLWEFALNTTHPSYKNRREIIAWLWRMRCALDPNFKDPYTEICRKIRNFSSDCSRKIRAKTCRKSVSINKRNTQKNHHR